MWVFLTITAGLGILALAWSALESYLQITMTYALGSNISDRMYEKFLDLEFWRYEDKSTIDLFDRA